VFDLLKKAETRGEPRNTHKPRLVTLKEAATLIDGLSEYRIRQLCNEGQLRHHKFGKKYMISDQELLRYFAS